MTHNRFLFLSLISLIVAIFSGFFLWNLSQTGNVLSLTTTRQKGTLVIEGAKNVAVNQAFSLKISVNSNNQNINAVGIFLHFDPDKIEVNEINTLKSFCQFYPEKKFDNRLGTISLSCGAPHPGVRDVSELIELRLTPLSIGTTSIRVDASSKVLLSDGKGTNILDEYPTWEVQIGTGL